MFGTTLSGRSACSQEVQKVENVVGLLINTVPVRLNVVRHQVFAKWLLTIQRLFSEIQQFESSSLLDVQSLSDIRKGIRLVDSLLVYENFPISVELLSRRSVALTVDKLESIERPSMPLSVVAQQIGDEMHMLLHYDCHHLSTIDAAEIGMELVSVLQSMPTATYVGDLSMSTKVTMTKGDVVQLK